MHCVNLGESFPTSIYLVNLFEKDWTTLLACLLACVDTAESEPLKDTDSAAAENTELVVSRLVLQLTLYMPTSASGTSRLKAHVALSGSVCT